ncbi:MAG: helix-turn-helix domain-containing protein, partial [Lentisphaeria bacterium]|nr:helix-turn-helix domain-containing protein [Lentisphaeria bacterium]
QYKQTHYAMPEVGEKPLIDLLLAGYERELITQAIKRSKGNFSEAGRELGISPRMMNYRMNKLGIKEKFDN